MDHEPVLISTLAIGLVAAFIGGLLARRVGLPSIVGYILAGVVVGPFTPGLIADRTVATELAEIGIILLMFGVGIEFSVKDLMAVRSIAIPGALIQVVVASALGIAFGLALGWGIGAGLVLGLAISVASTVVLLRAMTDRQELYTAQGRIAIGWLIVEDILMVVVLVALPSVAPLLGGAETPTLAGDLGLGPIVALALALGKTALFAILMIVFGARVVPWLLTYVARQGSRELFTLAVLAIALGLAFTSSVIFGVSFALGAFLAGAVVAESDLSQQAAADALPLRDAFAVLFFVSVGMLVDPAYLLANPLPIVGVLLLVVVGKALLKFAVVLLAGYPVRVSLTVAAGLAQIGEFSFILGTVGVSLGLLPADGFQLIVAGALLSITINPFLLDAIEPLEGRLRDNRALHRYLRWRAGDLGVLQPAEEAALRGHAILTGFGRVGRTIGPALDRRGFTYVVITLQRQEVDLLRARGIPAIYGDASNQEILEQAHVASARLVIVASSDPQSSFLIVQRAVAANPAIDVIVRTHTDDQAARLRAISPKVLAVHGERELGVQMARYSLRRFGVPTNEAEAIAQGLRHRAVR